MRSRNPAGPAVIGAVGVVLALSLVLGLSLAPITLAGQTRGTSAAPPSTRPPETFVNLNFVVSAGRSKPVAGATVMIDYNSGNGTERTTDSGGFCNFGVVSPRVYRYTVTKTGYGRVVGEVNVFGSEGGTVPIRLKPGS